MPRAVRSFSVSAAVFYEFAIVAIAQQRVVIRIRFQINAAAMPPVAAGWPAARHKFLPPERHAAVSAASSLHQNLCFINKHGSCFLSKNDNISIQSLRGDQRAD